MIHTIKDLKNQLSSNKIANVYLLFGGESFLLRESLKLIVKKVVPSDEYKDFNHDVFDCEKSNAHSIKEIVETLPIFHNQRLIVCRSAHLLKEKDWDILLPIIKDPVQTAVLVFTADQWDKRKKISKFLIEHCFSVENKQPSPKDLIQWMKWLCSVHDLSLSEDSTNLLIQLAGPGLMSIDNELRKLKSFAGSSKQVEPKDISQIVARVRPENIFSFTEAIGRQDVQKSFHYLIHLLEDQQSEIGLMALVARHIRILSEVKLGLKEGLSSSQISSRTGIPVFFIKDYIHQARLWDSKKIFKITEILHATDRALKSSPLSSDIWLENFVFKACSL